MSGRKRSGAENDDGGANAGASINKTLKDIEALLTGQDMTPHNNANMRIELRETLLKAFEKVGKSWYRKGFNRGHLEAYRHAENTGSVPRKLKATKLRSLTPSSKKRSISLSSTIRD